MDLLDKHYAILSSALRQSLVKNLILLRNRGQLESAEVLPLFFRLFRCQDKNLRDVLFKHIVAGMPTSLSNNPATATQFSAKTIKTFGSSGTAVSANNPCTSAVCNIQSALHIVKSFIQALVEVSMCSLCLLCNLQAAFVFSATTDRHSVTEDCLTTPSRSTEALKRESNHPSAACRHERSHLFFNPSRSTGALDKQSNHPWLACRHQRSQSKAPQ